MYFLAFWLTVIIAMTENIDIQIHIFQIFESPVCGASMFVSVEELGFSSDTELSGSDGVLLEATVKLKLFIALLDSTASVCVPLSKVSKNSLLSVICVLSSETLYLSLSMTLPSALTGNYISCIFRYWENVNSCISPDHTIVSLQLV